MRLDVPSQCRAFDDQGARKKAWTQRQRTGRLIEARSELRVFRMLQACRPGGSRRPTRTTTVRTADGQVSIGHLPSGRSRQQSVWLTEVGASECRGMQCTLQSRNPGFDERIPWWSLRLAPWSHVSSSVGNTVRKGAEPIAVVIACDRADVGRDQRRMASGCLAGASGRGEDSFVDASSGGAGRDAELLA